MVMFMLGPKTLSQLKRAVGGLEDAERRLIYGPTQTDGLKQLIEFLQPYSDQENIKTALPVLQQGLQELQQAPTEFINSVVQNVKNDFSGLKEAVNLVQNYFKATKSLDGILPQLQNTLSNLSISKVAITPDPRKIVLPLVGTVITDRSNLHSALGGSEGELNSMKPKISEGAEIKFLLMSSEKVLSNEVLKDSALSVFQRVAQFAAHLEEAREILKTLSRIGISWGGSETDDVQKILTNWEEATKKVAELETSASPSDVQLNRQTIAESIQIHDLLEVNYDYLSELVRSGDLVDPGNL
jgi:hypothetical protein